MSTRSALLLLFLLLLAAAFGLYLYGPGGMRSGPPLTAAAPEFSLPALEGGTVALADFRGKVVVLNFWASWCPPCVRELPTLADIQKDFGPLGVQVVGLSTDAEKDAIAFLREHPVGYPVALLTDEVRASYGGIHSIPVTFLLDRQGRIMSRIDGALTREELEPRLRHLLQP